MDLTSIFQTLDSDSDGFLYMTDIQKYLSNSQILEKLKSAKLSKEKGDFKFLADLRLLFSVFFHYQSPGE
jgi:hypothetical protein